jgi:hypothetical protein
MSIEKIVPSGGWLISDIVDGYHTYRRYFGYTKAQAVSLFKSEVGA